MVAVGVRIGARSGGMAKMKNEILLATRAWVVVGSMVGVSLLERA